MTESKTVTRKTQSARAFILGCPKDMPARELVQKAKAAGLAISIGYVHATRSNAKRAVRSAGTTATKSAATQGFTSFQQYVLRCGTDAVRKELLEIERRQAALTSSL